jgi:hypothetical protein
MNNIAEIMLDSIDRMLLRATMLHEDTRTMIEDKANEGQGIPGSARPVVPEPGYAGAGDASNDRG